MPTVANSCHVVHVSVIEAQHQFMGGSYKLATEKNMLTTHLLKWGWFNARQSIIMSF